VKDSLPCTALKLRSHRMKPLFHHCIVFASWEKNCCTIKIALFTIQLNSTSNSSKNFFNYYNCLLTRFYAKRSMQVIEISYLCLVSMTLQSRTSQVSLKNCDHCKKNDHCRFWHNDFATHWSVSVQCSAVWPIQWNKQARFLTDAMLSLNSLCVTAA